MKQQPEFLTEAEVAEWIRVGLRTLERERAEGRLKIPHMRIGGRVVYNRQAVLEAFFPKNSAEHYSVVEKPPKPLKTALEGIKRGRGRPRKIQTI